MPRVKKKFVWLWQCRDCGRPANPYAMTHCGDYQRLYGHKPAHEIWSCTKCDKHTDTNGHEYVLCCVCRLKHYVSWDTLVCKHDRVEGCGKERSQYTQFTKVQIR